MPDIVIHLVASAAYVGLAWHFWRTRWKPKGKLARAPDAVPADLRPWERVAILIPLVAHGWILYDRLFAQPQFQFGFAQALSAMLWLAALIYWVESLFFRLEGMQPMVLGAAGVGVLLPIWFSGRLLADSTSAEFRIHMFLAIVAYSLFTIAILHAVLMAIADNVLHNKTKRASDPSILEGPLANLPPLLTVERMFFRIVMFAFAFLTVTLATGMALSDTMFGRLLRFNHETVFAVMSWITFAILLWGRFFRGWRGRTALRWTVAGFVMVVLANIGTAFVLEVILRRP